MTKPSSPSCQTFSDWGVVVPFTTPTLSHARLRPGRNGRLDVLMRNPAGGKGVYVFDLGALGELFTLTLHDRLLYERLVELDTPTPDTIRQAVRDVAAEGAAGRAAKRAAELEHAEEEAARLAVELHLLSGLLRGAGAGEIDWRRVRDGEAAFRAYIRGRLDEVAPRIGVGRDALLATLDQIAAAAAHVGVEQSGRPGRNERRIAALAGLVADLEGWGGGDAAADLAGRIVRAADRSLRLARTAHEEARGLLGDAVALVRAWRADGEVPRTVLARSDWLLDGWAQVCPVWEEAARADRAAQREAVERVAALVPFLDQPELGQGAGGNGEERLDVKRRVRLNEDWRTGLVLLEQTARNEALRAAAA